MSAAGSGNGHSNTCDSCHLCLSKWAAAGSPLLTSTWEHILHHQTPRPSSGWAENGGGAKGIGPCPEKTDAPLQAPAGFCLRWALCPPLLGGEGFLYGLDGAPRSSLGSIRVAVSVCCKSRVLVLRPERWFWCVNQLYLCYPIG